jgi:hypothetical protein
MAIIERLARERRENGHNFAFDRDVCTRCGMSLEDYEDHGKPRCLGRPPTPPDPPQAAD